MHVILGYVNLLTNTDDVHVNGVVNNFTPLLCVKGGVAEDGSCAWCWLLDQKWSAPGGAGL